MKVVDTKDTFSNHTQGAKVVDNEGKLSLDNKSLQVNKDAENDQLEEKDKNKKHEDKKANSSNELQDLEDVEYEDQNDRYGDDELGAWSLENQKM